MIHRRRSERGEFNFVTVVLVLGLLGSVYWGWRFGPIYLEANRAQRLTRQAMKYWLNVDSRMEMVKKNLQMDLNEAMVESITAEDVTFEMVDSQTARAYWYYEVEVTHPAILSPTLLEFEFDETLVRTLSPD